MAKQIINIGVEGNDGTGDSIREAFRKTNENFTEIYAVFGVGGQITFTALSDTPNDHVGNEGKILAANQTGTALQYLELASDSALNPTNPDTIEFDYTLANQGTLVLTQGIVNINKDPRPSLLAGLDADGKAIVNPGVGRNYNNLSELEQNVTDLNSIHGTSYTVDDAVITKGLSDARYLKRGKPGIHTDIRDEPINDSEYKFTIVSYNADGYRINITSHGFDSGINGKPFVYSSTGNAAQGLNAGQIYYIRFYDEDNVTLHPTEADAKGFDLDDPNAFLAGYAYSIVGGIAGGTGTQTLTDNYYDATIPGFYQSQEALPRKAVVRRQGDKLEGALTLHDHPGDLAGKNEGLDDKDYQAATRFYVDSQSFASTTNLFVSTKGDDSMINVPGGKEGRSYAYAFASVNKACQRAEEIMLAAPVEAGPYVQTITHTGHTIHSVIDDVIDPEIEKDFNIVGTGSPIPSGLNFRVTSQAGAYTKVLVTLPGSGFNLGQVLTVPGNNLGGSSPANDLVLTVADIDTNGGVELFTWTGSAFVAEGRETLRACMEANYDFIVAETIAYINDNIANSRQTTFTDGDGVQRTADYTDFEYNEDICARDTRLIAKSVVLDAITGDAANYLSVLAGTRYYLNNSGLLAIREQRNPTVDAIRFAQNLSLDIIQNPGGLPGTRYQTEIAYTQVVSRVTQPITAADTATVNARFENIVDTIYNGPLQAPTVTDGTPFQLRITNGGNNFVDQADPQNIDLRSGKIVIGKSSGARGRIVNYYSESVWDTRPDIVDSTPGTDYMTIALLEPIEFFEGEELEFGNRVRENQITLHIESGIYREDLPIKVPTNVSIKGDEFRRVLIRPKDRRSQSPWAKTYFYRDRVFDGLTADANTSSTGIADTNLPYDGVPYYDPLTNPSDPTGWFGNHYLVDPTRALNVYPTGIKPNNAGKYFQAAELIEKNKDFIVDDCELFMQAAYGSVADLANPGGWLYSRATLQRRLRDTVDKIVADLEKGDLENVLTVQGNWYDYDFRTQGPGFGNELTGLLGRIKTLADYILTNTQAPGSVLYTSETQYINNDLTSEAGADTTLDQLVDLITYAFSGSYNPPKNNLDMDFFMMNDGTILRNITVQGQGGFMCVLDPEGQILTRSPYIQVGSSFSRSINVQAFRGGMYIDAFSANIPMEVFDKEDDFTLKVRSPDVNGLPSGLKLRRPQVPAPFYIDGKRYQVNAVNDYNPAAGTATLILDSSSNLGQGFDDPSAGIWTNFTYNKAKCQRDIKYLLDSIRYDIIFDSNYRSISSALQYLNGTASVTINNQRAQTVESFDEAKSLTYVELSDPVSIQRANSLWDEIIDIVSNGTVGSAQAGTPPVDAYSYPTPTGGVNNASDAGYYEAVGQLIANKQFLQEEVVKWVASQVAGNIAPFTSAFVYDAAACERDAGLIIDALIYDLTYGGNLQTIDAARAYFIGTNSVIAGQEAETIAAYTRLQTIIGQAIREDTISLSPGNTLTQNFGGPAGSAAAATDGETRVQEIMDYISGDGLTPITVITPDISWVSANLQADFQALNTPTQDKIAVATTDYIDGRIASGSGGYLVGPGNVGAPDGYYTKPITLQTAGNRSMLGNDFTQINDLGYGLVVVNGALSEMVSMFTYYCWTSYYSGNGAQIRSITGSSINGEYGLVAVGSDPNEVPDDVTLSQNMVQTARSAGIRGKLVCNASPGLAPGDLVRQVDPNTTVETTATVVYSTGTYGKEIYISNLENGFEIGQPDGSTIGYLEKSTDNGVTWTPIWLSGGGPAHDPQFYILEVINYNADNLFENTALNIYETEFVPTSSGELETYHPEEQIIGRYEVAGVDETGFFVDGYNGLVHDNTQTATTVWTSSAEYYIDYTANPVGSRTNGNSAEFTVHKAANTLTSGVAEYKIVIDNGGSNYNVGDTFVISGYLLGGQDVVNDLTVQVVAINDDSLVNGVLLPGTYAVEEVTISGTPEVVQYFTPERNGSIFKLSFTTGSEGFDGGLAEYVPTLTETSPGSGTYDYQVVDIRSNNVHEFNQLNDRDKLDIRPSTAINFDESVGATYRTIDFGKSDAAGNALAFDTSLVTFDAGYDYIRPITGTNAPLALADPDVGKPDSYFTGWSGTTFGSTVGDRKIALTSALSLPDLASVIAGTTAVRDDQRLNQNVETYLERIAQNETTPIGSGSVVYDNTISSGKENFAWYNPVTNPNVPAFPAPIFTWGGAIYKMYNYREYSVGGQVFPAVSVVKLTELPDSSTFTGNLITTGGDGLASPIVRAGVDTITLRAGLQEGSEALLTVNISTCRATGHDFSDVGTGGFNTTNYPNVILGLPAKEPQQTKEVDERNKGRVFYVSTDQDGFFRVGRFFSVDQGTGTVSFASSIALSNLDGLGFKRGVTINEFSDDTGMTDNSPDAVPVESAVRGYVNRRLGFDHTGSPISPADVITEVLTPDGRIVMTGDLNFNTQFVPVNLAPPVGPLDATNKEYVDDIAKNQDTIRNLVDTTVTAYDENQLLITTGKYKIFIDDVNPSGESGSGTFQEGMIFDNVRPSVGGSATAFGEILQVSQKDIPGFGACTEIVYELNPDSTSYAGPGQFVASSVGNEQFIRVIDAPAGIPDRPVGRLAFGPKEEWVNVSSEHDSDILIDVFRHNSGSTVDLAIRPGSIVNNMVNYDAQIAQSKLDMEFADASLLTPSGISQSDLGLAHFNPEEFESTQGWIELKDATTTSDGIEITKHRHLNSETVIGRYDVGGQAGAAQYVTFSSVVLNSGEITTSGQTDKIPQIAENNNSVPVLTTPALAIGTNDEAIVLSTDGQYVVMSDGLQEGQILKARGASGDVEVISDQVLTWQIGSGGNPAIATGPSAHPLLANTAIQNSGNLGVSSIRTTLIMANEQAVINPGASQQTVTDKTAIAIGVGGDANIGAINPSTSTGTPHGTIAMATMVVEGTSQAVKIPATFSSYGIMPDNDTSYRANIADENGDNPLDPSDPNNGNYSQYETIEGFNIGSSTNPYAGVYAKYGEFQQITGDVAGTAVRAKYADLAENYLGDNLYEPGTVLIFGGQNEVTETSQRDDRRIAGVVSAKPAYLMNDGMPGEFVNCVALQGRVPCKVIGKVEKGDMLVSAAMPGYAIVNNEPRVGTVIGKALESKTDAGKGIIEVVVGRV